MSTPSPEDIILVSNPDIGCSDIDNEEGWNHSDYFQVRWAGQPHRITPGATRRMPRYVAEHYAKHLANHILGKMELTTGRRGLMNSPVERPKVINSILVNVEEYFIAETPKSEGEKVAEQVNQLNSVDTERYMDLGEVPNPLYGVTRPEPKDISEEIIKAQSEELDIPETKTSIFNDEKPLPSRASLLKQANDLGLDITGKETKEQLVSKIKSF